MDRSTISIKPLTYDRIRRSAQLAAAMFLVTRCAVVHGAKGAEVDVGDAANRRPP